MKVKLPPLLYALDALEPHISKTTLDVHYHKHHQKYVDNTNKLIAGTPYEDLQLEEIIVESSRRKEDEAIFNNSAQVFNHTFYWHSMSPKKIKPSHELTLMIQSGFDSFEKFKDQFKKVAVELFGSGWIWLVKDEHNLLSIMSLKDGDTPVAHNKVPLLALDVWEHAYYLDYKNERGAYFDHFWRLVNWDFVERNTNIDILSHEGNPILSDDFMNGMNSSLYLGYS